MRFIVLCLVLSAVPAFAQETAEIEENPLVARQQELVEVFYRSMGPRVIQVLTASGLSEADSEQVARRYAEDIAQCGITMITDEADRQSTSIEELMIRFMTTVGSGEWNRPAVTERMEGVIDVGTVSTGLFPCITAATQRAGLSYEEESRASSEQMFPNEPEE